METCLARTKADCKKVTHFLFLRHLKRSLSTNVWLLLKKNLCCVAHSLTLSNSGTGGGAEDRLDNQGIFTMPSFIHKGFTYTGMFCQQEIMICTHI